MSASQEESVTQLASVGKKEHEQLQTSTEIDRELSEEQDGRKITIRFLKPT
jgi:hypothetical protein